MNTKINELKPTTVGILVQIFLAYFSYFFFRENLLFFPIYLFSSLIFIFSFAAILDSATKKRDEFLKGEKFHQNIEKTDDSWSAADQRRYAKNKTIRFFVNGYIFSFAPSVILIFNLLKK